jgi:hypothetical protein
MQLRQSQRNLGAILAPALLEGLCLVPNPLCLFYCENRINVWQEALPSQAREYISIDLNNSKWNVFCSQIVK